MSRAWVVRTGKYGERDQWALSRGVTGGGWSEFPDLTACHTREEVATVVAQAVPEQPVQTHINYTGQLWALRGRIEVGDLMVLPLKTTKQIALGRVSGGYRYDSQQEDLSKRHLIEVDWRVTDLSRSKVKQDLLYRLGSALTIFAPSKGFAFERLEALLQTGEDPGLVPFTRGLPTRSPARQVDDAVEDAEEPELHADIIEVARDQITARIREEFVGDDLEILVQEILEAEGFTCSKSRIGADRGIDIVAGRGILGMDSPRVVVQVKSGSQVGDSVVRDLNGVIHSQGADQGLLVAWGGLSRPAQESVLARQFRIRVWTSEDIVDAVLRVYDKLSDEIRARIPLTRLWILNEQSGA